MRLEPTPRVDHIQRVSARLITASTILHLSSDELESAVAQEQLENPALEVNEQRICLYCGSPLHGQICASCGYSAQLTQPAFTTSEYRIDDYGPAEAEDDEEFDPLARLPMGQTLAEVLLQQLVALIAADDAPIAEQLVGNLNERGYLEISVQEIAEHLVVPVERVAYVLSQLQTLEPPGIGARDLRECLLIQLRTLSEQEMPHPLAYILIDRYLDRLRPSRSQEIARELKVTEQEVHQAIQYIRRTLHPYPAHTYQATARTTPAFAAYTRPDIIIRKIDTGFEIELIEEKRYRFYIGPGYGTQLLSLDSEPINEDVQHYLRHHSDRAKFFIVCVQRRWHTLKRITELIVDYQREFLEKGVRYLRPLTRAEVANRLSLDEGTVSRATANKYALLPNGRLMPVSDFFDGSLGIKDVIRELISTEEPRHRLSDEELARLLTVRGIPMARRTVTKYREEMGIASSRER
ncbi:MAG TPA: RNA polymerase factor sigma-54 [Ktedonobacteraceae bacterium]|nr:RNA polymerase factor sigma-54 [Ktedonobacteraceae bacterium]